MSKKKFVVQIYTSLLTSSHLYIKGRVLKDRSPMSFVNQGPISSLFNTLLRALSKEVPSIPIRCYYGVHLFELETDEEGYFEVFHNVTTIESSSDTFRIEGVIKGETISFTRKLTSYRYNVPKGIISDIDDTIMVSKVRSFFKLRLLINTVFINPFRRKPIDSAAEAFHKMVVHTEGQSPMIYLSNSPWNIYDYLQNFLLHHEFPTGELILRDMGTRLLRSRDITEYNKYIEIEKVLIAFKDTRFTLIGDTGEKDFNIYLAILEKHPERIEEIILNNAGNRKKIQEITAYLDNAEEKKVTIVKGYKEMI